MNTRQFFKHRYVHALEKLATAEGIELPSLRDRVQNLTAELSASAFLKKESASTLCI